MRLRDFTEAMQVGDAPGLYSICQDDYSAVLSQIASTIKQQLKPACVHSCVRDIDPTSGAIDASCRIVQQVDGAEPETIVPCEPDGDAWKVPAGATVCHALLGDAGGVTPEVRDDMSVDEETGAVTCADEGWNLEIKILHSAPPPSGSRVRAICELAEDRSVSCPNLPAGDACG